MESGKLKLEKFRFRVKSGSETGINLYAIGPRVIRRRRIVSRGRNLTAQWKQSGVNMAELDSINLQQLKAYSELNNAVAAKAIALQQLNGDSSYLEPVYAPETGDKSNTNTRRKRTVISESKMLLYPNPADGYFTIEYQLTDMFKTAQIVVFDINGKIVEQQEIHYDIDQVLIPSDNWPAGQYTVSLFADGKTMMTKKITLSK